MCNYNKKSNKTIKSKTFAATILKILLGAPLLGEIDREVRNFEMHVYIYIYTYV